MNTDQDTAIMKKSQNKIERGSGSLLLELMMVIGLTAITAAQGSKMIGKHHEISTKLDAKNELILESDTKSWTKATLENIEIDGGIISMNVVERKW